MAVRKATEETEVNEAPKQDVTPNDVMAKIDEMIAEKLAEAQKKADEIVKEAEEKAKAVLKGNESPDTSAANAELEEYVEVKLFKDNGKYKDDVFVGVNGENCVIRRGERVKIKKKFANVLEQSDLQDYKTSQLIDSKEREYESSAREHGL